MWAHDPRSAHDRSKLSEKCTPVMEYLPWHMFPFSTTIFWTALWSSVSVGSDGRRWVYQKEQVSPSIIQPAIARNPGIERLAIDSFPTTAVSNWYVYLKLLTIDRCASSLKINITQMEAFGATPVFFTVCVCEQETEDDSIFSVPLWKSHASWNQTISFSYHCLPSTTICQRIVQGRNQIAKQKTPPPSNEGYGWVKLEVCDIILAKQRLFWSVLAGGSGPDSAADGFLRWCCVLPALWCVSSVVVWGWCRWQPWGFNGLMGSDQLEQLQPSWALISYEWACRRLMFLPAPPVHNRVLNFLGMFIIGPMSNHCLPLMMSQQILN